MPYITSPAIERELKALAWTAWHQPRPDGTTRAWIYVSSVGRLAQAVVDRDWGYILAEDTLAQLPEVLGELLKGAVVGEVL